MIDKNPYAGNFNKTRHQETSYAAEKILTILLDSFTVRNAVDVGCGVGTFLSFLEQRGVSDILGIDGDWVKSDLLVISSEKFTSADLKTLPKYDRVYDLAICLEVAEHLPPENAAGFVTKLCELSPLVLFSAAIPRQGGTAHVNEAWQSYWAKLFAKHNYYPSDIIRSKIWGDSAIPFWYRQNILVYTKQSKNPNSGDANIFPLDVVHPELFLMRTPDHLKITGKASLHKRIFRRIQRIVKKWQ